MQFKFYYIYFLLSIVFLVAAGFNFVTTAGLSFSTLINFSVALVLGIIGFYRSSIKSKSK